MSASLLDELHVQAVQKLKDKRQSKNMDAEIFVVDDEQIVIDTLSYYLSKAGFENIHGFSSSTEAIDTLRFIQPSIILTDIHMPDVSGSFLTRLIRTFSHLKSVPIVVVTSDKRPETAEAIIAKGADSVLVKPVKEEDFIKHVKQTLKKSAMLKELVTAAEQELQESEEQKRQWNAAAIRINESNLRDLYRK